MNKKGVDLIYGTVIFIILNALFFATLFLFIQRAGENVIFTEQKYAKQIGLLVDRAKPGTIIKLNVEEFDKFIDKNKLNEAETISFQSNSVVVKLGKGEGYKFNLVSNNPIDKSFYRNNDGNLILSLQVRVE